MLYAADNLDKLHNQLWTKLARDPKLDTKITESIKANESV